MTDDDRQPTAETIVHIRRRPDRYVLCFAVPDDSGTLWWVRTPVAHVSVDKTYCPECLVRLRFYELTHPRCSEGCRVTGPEIAASLGSDVGVDLG